MADSGRLSNRIAGIGINHRKGALIAASIAFAILLVAWFFIGKYNDEHLHEHEREFLIEISGPVESSISSAIGRRLAVLDSVHAFVMAHEESEIGGDFPQFANGLMSGIPGILVFIIAPDGIISVAEPLEGNETALGFDFLKDSTPEVIKDLEAAIETQKAILSGPYELPQKMTGILIRRAVLKNGEFWGFVSIAFDPDLFYDSAGLDDVPDSLDIALVNHNGDVVFGNENVAAENPHTFAFDFADKKWTLAVMPADGWGTAFYHESLVFKLSTLFLALALSILVFMYFDRRGKLENAVKMRTEELSHLNETLESEIAERISAERANAAALERLESILDSMPIGCVITSPNYIISYWNKAAEKILEFSQDEVFGKNFFDLIIPDAAKEHVEQVVEKILSGAPIYNSQNENITKSGKTIYCDWMNTPLKDELGNLQGVLSMFRDVTGEIKSKETIAENQKRLAENEERFRLLAENASDIIYKYRLFPEPGFEYVSPSCFAVTGYTPEEHYADPLLAVKIIHPDDRHILSGVSEHPEVLLGTVEIRWIKKDGSVVWTEQQNTPVYDAKGNVIAIHGIARDVTERKESEARAAQMNELLQKVLSNLDEAVLIVEFDSRTIIDANSKAESMFGYTREELIGFTTKKLHVDSQAFELFGLLANPQLKTAGYFACEYSLKRKDGTIFPTEHYVTMLDDATSNTKKSISFVRDISRRKRADAERDNLERQLKQAQKLEAIGQLAGGIAHDFNNILTGIFGYCDIADETLDSGNSAKADIAAIREAAHRAANLTSRLLTFSRQQVVQTSKVGLNKLISGLVVFLRKVIGEHIDLTFLPSAAHETIECDPALIEQMLMNLAVNARDAMPDGGSLEIRTYKALVTQEMYVSGVWPAPGEFAVIEVSDTGHGMEPHILERIYEPFFTTKEVGKGTGLGLAMVYGIVKQHNGAITAESAPGKGTKFCIYLPAAAGEESASSAEHEPAPEGGTETVLIAEDEDGLRKLARRALERAGYSVLAASNGSEALALFEVWHEEIDIVVLDVVMPKMGGIDAFGRMKEISPDFKTLFTSGYTADKIPAATETETGISFMPKPYTVTGLLTAIRKLLDG